MGIYRWEGQTALDIWIKNHCLSIIIDSAKGKLWLFVAGLDSVAAPDLLFAGSNSKEDWLTLKNRALTLSH